VAVFDLGPVGQFCTRIALRRGAEQVIGVDIEPERLRTAARYGVDTVDARGDVDAVEEILRLTAGRGTDSTIDAVGMEAHGSPVAAGIQKLAGLLPDAAGAALAGKVGVDRMSALHDAIGAVRRGGTVSVVGVYGGAVDPMPMMTMFDKGITVRMGQAHVKRWIGDIMPLLMEETDPLGTEVLATHHLSLDAAPTAYRMFQEKSDGVIKVVLHP
jgi:threonine dehydrogenase-like Zn-dependent dehydrogenase